MEQPVCRVFQWSAACLRLQYALGVIRVALELFDDPSVPVEEMEPLPDAMDADSLHSCFPVFHLLPDFASANGTTPV